MAFHPYPQVIRAVFNPHRFGPPPPVTAASTCSKVDRHGFGSTPTYVRPVQTRFRSGSGPEGLNLHVSSNSPDHNAKGTQSGPCGPSHSLSAHGFRICFTRHLAYFSPFPHGTRALSVIEEYLGLEGGPPGFAQHSTCAALLGIPLGVVTQPVTGLSPSLAGHSRPLHPRDRLPCRGPTTPVEQAPPVWPLPRSLTATSGISVDFCSCRY